MRLLVAALKAGHELSAREAAAVAIVSRQHARRLLASLMADRRVHIDRWERHAWGPYWPVYAIGDFPSAARPKAVTTAERSRRYRERNRIPRPDPLAKAMRNMGGTR